MALEGIDKHWGNTEGVTAGTSIVVTQLHPALRAVVAIPRLEYEIQDSWKQEEEAQNEAEKAASPCFFLGGATVTTIGVGTDNLACHRSQILGVKQIFERQIKGVARLPYQVNPILASRRAGGWCIDRTAPTAGRAGDLASPTALATIDFAV